MLFWDEMAQLTNICMPTNHCQTPNFVCSTKSMQVDIDSSKLTDINIEIVYNVIRYSGNQFNVFAGYTQCNH